ncbi:putative nucleic acid-binding protein [Emiliania huxleyi virus 18]|nr:putative nucleic acid-binding protein [Emiliania huxleyi virus 18]AHA55271.1 putative nucleic acid-binding protein [Emiliania huxleyi virus 156]
MSTLDYVIDMSQSHLPGYVHLTNLNKEAFPPTATVSAFGESSTVVLLPYTADRVENNTNVVITSAIHNKVGDTPVLVVLGARKATLTDLQLEKMNITHTPGGILKKRTNQSLVTPISEIGTTPGNVKIQGVVTFKNCRPYKNGFMCKFRIQDESGNIGMTAWNDTYDKFDQLIEQNKTYVISGMTVKKANPAYETQHTHEITLKSTSTVE